jgi:hypothetical protein
MTLSGEQKKSATACRAVGVARHSGRRDFRTGPAAAARRRSRRRIIGASKIAFLGGRKPAAFRRSAVAWAVASCRRRSVMRAHSRGVEAAPSEPRLQVVDEFYE